MTTNTRIALLIAMMVNAVLFGIGAIAVLSVPALNAHAPYLLPVVIAVSFLAAPFIARMIAPHMRSRRWWLWQQPVAEAPAPDPVAPRRISPDRPAG